MLRERLDRGLERVVSSLLYNSACELVVASIVTKIDKRSKGLLNKPRFKIFRVNL